jgi:hypothetical protein
MQCLFEWHPDQVEFLVNLRSTSDHGFETWLSICGQGNGVSFRIQFDGFLTSEII